MDATQDLLTYQEAADRLGLSMSGLRRAVAVDTLEPVLVKGSKWLRLGDVDTYHERKGRPGRSWRVVAAAKSMQAPAAPSPVPPATATQAPATAPAPAAPSVVPSPEEIAAIKARASAAGAPLLDGWREASKGLTAIGLAALLGAGGPDALSRMGALLDPKRIAG